ncbi:hypothetical protein QCA50_014968 [Cerrena zonata]|uniref:N-acetyltransferase domain-containing protein n=1 Tax=Cerrena zonata TaxID=2478898 RepID=A0AAW0FR07_9APHY
MTEPYNVNFCFPVRELENDKLNLTPFVPSIHSQRWFAASREFPEIYDHVPFGPFSKAEDFVNVLLTNRVQPSPSSLLFIILDKVRAKPGRSPDELPIAGIIGLLNTSVDESMTEIAFVFTLPPYQRSHVTSNSVGLLLAWCLDPPSESGLGLRRVQWQCNQLNAASRRVAERMGFKFEAIIRWQRVLPIGKEGPMVSRQDGRKDNPGRHTVMLSLCWDEWEEAKENVRKQMNRS